jgi:hypothetical protein
MEAYYDQAFDLSQLPPFLEIEKEVTGQPQFSMFNLSIKDRNGDR